MEVYSSDRYRTIKSAESQLSGLYPDGTGPTLTEGQQERAKLAFEFEPSFDPKEKALPFAHQPIPIHILGYHSIDHIIRGYGSDNCPKIPKDQEAHDATQAMQDKLNFYKEKLFPAIQRETGFLPQTWADGTHATDELFCGWFNQNELKFKFSDEEFNLMLQFGGDYFYNE